MKICHDQGYNDNPVVIVTKWQHYLYYLQLYFSALGTLDDSSIYIFEINRRFILRLSFKIIDIL